jgi:hypothetical protein
MKRHILFRMHYLDRYSMRDIKIIKRRILFQVGISKKIGF